MVKYKVASTDEHLYSSTFVGAGLDLNKNNERAAIIGGGDGGVARECISKILILLIGLS
jgi:spermidine synthase